MEESAPSIIKVAELKQSTTSLMMFQSKLFAHYYVDKCNLITVTKLNRDGKPGSSVQINLRIFIGKYFRETSYSMTKVYSSTCTWYMCVGVSDENVASIIQVERCNLTNECRHLRITHVASMMNTNVLYLCIQRHVPSSRNTCSLSYLCSQIFGVPMFQKNLLSQSLAHVSLP